MRKLGFLFVALFLGLTACEGDVGDECSDEGKVDGECDDGAVCGKNAQNEPVCLKQCTNQGDCGSGENCSGIANTNLKGCRPSK